MFQRTLPAKASFGVAWDAQQGANWSYRARAALVGRAVVFVPAVVVFAAYSALSVASYLRFAAHSYDLGIFEEAIRQYASLRAPIVHIKGAHLDILGDHFSPLLAILAPIYRCFPSALTLDLAQNALFAISVATVSKLAVRKTTTCRGIAIGIAYGLAWGLQQAVAVDFHEICLGVPLLALSLAALVEQRWRACVLWALPLVLVKEDLGLTVAVIGICAVLRGQKELGTRLALFGVSATAVTVLLIMPTISSTGHYSYWKGLDRPGGATLLSLAANLFNPPGTKLVTLAMIFGVSGFLAIRSPLALVAIPTLLWRFTADVPTYWGTDWHYNAILMPIVFIALIDAIVISRRSKRGWMRSYGANIAPAAAAAAVAFSGQFPVATLIDPATYATGVNAVQARQALADIRSGSSVETDPGLMAHLTSRCDVYFITRGGNPPPDYLVVSTAWMPSVTDAAQFAEHLHPEAHYVTLFSSSGYQVAERAPAS